MNDIDVDKIKIELNYDQLFITIGKYKLFITNKEIGGLDALILYFHLMFTARLQVTRSIKANNFYLKNGLGWGDAKLKKAKSFLKKYGLIEYIQRRNEDGTLGEQYIVVKMSTDGSNIGPLVQETDLSVDRTTGSKEQMLKQESKCLNKKDKCLAPCTIEEVKEYVIEKGLKHTDPQAFMDHYDLVGWVYGKNKVKLSKWRLAVNQWDRRTGKWEHDATKNKNKPFRDRNGYLESIEQLIEDGDAIITPDGQIDMVDRKLLGM